MQMNTIVNIWFLLAILVISAGCYKSDDSFLNIPDEYIIFNDQSALVNKQNLKSKQYNDFIHTLYKFDADNLQKFENLATKAELLSKQQKP